MCVQCAWRFQGSISFSSSNPRPSSLFSTQPAQPPSCNLLHWAKLHCNHSKLEYIIACRLNLCWRECTPKLTQVAFQSPPLPKDTRVESDQQFENLCRWHLSWSMKNNICPGSHVRDLFKLMTPLISRLPWPAFRVVATWSVGAITEPLNW